MSAPTATTEVTPAAGPPAGGPVPAPVDIAVPSSSVTGRRRRSASPVLVATVAVLALYGLAAIAPTLLATHSPTAIDLDHALEPPSASHWFGTDESGRDLYSRVVHGTRESLLIGIGAAGVAILSALVLGTLAALSRRGVWRRGVRGAVDWLVEVLLAFPTLLLALLLVAVLGPSAWTQVVAVGVGSAPGYARIVRGQILTVKGAGYVEAAVALGRSGSAVLRRHVLPNALRPLVAVFALAVGQSIVWASSLSFLGLGVAPPSSEWGALLDAGDQYVTRAPWLTVIPGAVIVVFALAATSAGRLIRDRLERGDA